MTTDTTPAAPTAPDYRAALALIDSYAFTDGYDPRAASDMRAVFAVARASVVERAWRTEHYRADASGEHWRGTRADLDNALDDTDAAVADLVALAKGGAS